MYQANGSRGDFLRGVLVAIAWSKICRNGPQGSRLCREVQNPGLEIDLAETNGGAFVLGHTDKRREELLATLHEFLLAEKVDVKI